MIPRTLLLIVPTVPALTGNGLAMRAALVLQLLAARHDVSLLIVPLLSGLMTREFPAPLYWVGIVLVIIGLTLVVTK